MMGETRREGIVVLGCPRSGTTLLRRLLDAHPAISAPGETYLLSAASRFLDGERMVDGLEVGVLNGVGFLGFDEAALLDRLREFIFAFRREHAAREGKRRWLEKTAVDAFHVDAIRRICGSHVHYICLVRHGLDVVCSMEDWIRKSKAYPAELHRYIQSEPRRLFAFAKAWADTSATIANFAAAQNQDAVLIRYEDLVTDPDAELAKLLAFLGEAPELPAVDAALATQQAKGFSDWKSFSKNTIETQAIDRWRQALPGETASELALIVNPVLTELGYPEIPERPEFSSEQKRRRYEIGLSLQTLS